MAINVGSAEKLGKTGRRPCSLSIEGLPRTISDLSFRLSSEVPKSAAKDLSETQEVEDAKCECCGMSEECSPEYIRYVRDRFCGRLICGLCSEAVMEEMNKNQSEREEAVEAHMRACVRFNRIGRTHPVLYQADAVREIFKKSSLVREKSLSPRDVGVWATDDRVRRHQRKNGISRSPSYIPAITKQIGETKIIN